MNRMSCRFLISLVSVVLVACGSKAFRHQNEVLQEHLYSMAVERERARVLPHLHYSLDVYCIDNSDGTVGLSFYFVKEKGDSLLWVECVERVPMSLVDTALCHRWFNNYK